MFDVKTPLSKLHRVSRRIPSSFVASPGMWAAVGTDGNLSLIASRTDAPMVLKPILGNASSSQYESNDIKVGSIATIESPFRATVDGVGFAKVYSGSTSCTAALVQGAELSVNYQSTATATTDTSFCNAADLGKLKVAKAGELVVARVENLNALGTELTYETVTPHVKA